jgi:hypothetical protein
VASALYPMEMLQQSTTSQNYSLQVPTLHIQGTGRRGQNLYPREWADVGATHSFNQEGEYTRVWNGTSEIGWPEGRQSLTNPDNATRRSGQYVFINDRYKAQNGNPYPTPKMAEKIIGTAVQ